MGVFMLTGSVSILLQAHAPFLHLSELAANAIFALAAASALFIACYDGFLMRSSAGVAFSADAAAAAIAVHVRVARRHHVVIDHSRASWRNSSCGP